MEVLINANDEQLIFIYKIYREQQDPSYPHKTGVFKTYGTSFAEKINSEKEQFHDIYYPHIKNGYLVILDENGNVVGSGSKIGGDITINITDSGIQYVETNYPSLK